VPGWRLYSIPELAHEFGVSDMTVNRWIKRGILDAAKVGHAWRIPEAAVVAFIHRYFQRHAGSSIPFMGMRGHHPGLIKRFTGKHAFLATDYPCMIRFRGRVWASVEHAYQGSKTERGSKEEQAIAEADTGLLARSLAQRFHLERPSYARILMYRLLQAKFRDKTLEELLLGTGEDHIEYWNEDGDTHWGVDSATGAGRNWLGKLLEVVREEIRTKRYRRAFQPESSGLRADIEEEVGGSE